MSDVLTNEITVKVRGEDYVFAIPSVTKNIELGIRARAIRRKYDPSGLGDTAGLDMETAMLAWGCAVFEVLLKKASWEWPFTKDEKTGKPYVDSERFDGDKTDLILEVVSAYDQEYARFRRGGAADQQPAAGEVVAGS